MLIWRNLLKVLLYNLFFNPFSLPTRHILKLGQDHLASLCDAQGTPLVSLFDVKGPSFFQLFVLI